MHRAFVTWLNSLPSNHPARSLAVTATVTFHTSTQAFHVYLDESECALCKKKALPDSCNVHDRPVVSAGHTIENTRLRW